VISVAPSLPYVDRELTPQMSIFSTLFGKDLEVVQGTEPHPDDETPILRGPTTPLGSLLKGFAAAPQVKTAHDVLEYSLARRPQKNAYSTRVWEDGQLTDRYESVTYAEFGEMRAAVGSYLLTHRKPNEVRIGICSYSRMEWDIVEYACYSQNFVVVPVYDTFGAENVNYIINHTELQTLFILASKLSFFAANVFAHCPQLKEIIVIEGPEPIPISEIEIPAPITVTLFKDVVSFADRQPFHPPVESDLCCITFTSGTTAFPKGVMLTHHNVIVAAAALDVGLLQFYDWDVYFSYLPLAHILEFIIHILLTYLGACAAFYSGSIPRLSQDMAICRPTIFVGVGRVFERLYSGITDKINAQPFYKRWILKSAIGLKGFLLDNFRMRRVPVVEKVFSPIRSAFGGRLRCIVLGGSAFPASAQRWLGIVLGAPFGIGYGLTETSVAACIQNLGNDTLMGSIGVVLGCNEAKLKSVPELGYDVRDGVGEIYFRGESVFSGYYKNEAETQKVLMPDGWFKTGDVCRLSPTGQLSIVGRNKDIVKLLQGEYVAIPRVTELYQGAPFVNQIYVHAGVCSRFLTAIVVLKDGVRDMTEKTAIEEFDRIADANGLNGYEKLKRLHLTYTEFSLENGCLTPSMKPARHKIEQTYSEVIRQLEKIE
jgi:long-chain acyl-CoA synthetase